jgi:type IV secretory pathway VirJ component
MKRISKAIALLLIFTGTSFPQDTLDIRGQQQQLHLYGPREGIPVILSSGDLGWAGFVVQVAEFLAAQGYYVVGFNSRAYLTSFTTRDSSLSLRDIPGDYGTLIEYSRKKAAAKPILAGISEGAGLSVLAASDRGLKERIQGVLGLGLPNQIELGWKWQDFTIWITKKAPKEPSFMVVDIIAAVSPAPLAEIHSTHDEFLPLEQAKSMFALAKDPKKMWVVEASNHRFGDNRNDLDRCILEALRWISSNPR